MERENISPAVTGQNEIKVLGNVVVNVHIHALGHQTAAAPQSVDSSLDIVREVAQQLQRLQDCSVRLGVLDQE